LCTRCTFEATRKTYQAVLNRGAHNPSKVHLVHNNPPDAQTGARSRGKGRDTR